MHAGPTSEVCPPIRTTPRGVLAAGACGRCSAVIDFVAGGIYRRVGATAASIAERVVLVSRRGRRTSAVPMVHQGRHIGQQ